MSVRDQLNAAPAIPWIPDPAKAAAYDKDSCQENPLVGIAVDHYRRTNFRGDGEYDVLVLNVDGVGHVSVHCQPTVLANAMREAKPTPGEEVGVVWKGEQISANGTKYALYQVVVDRANRSFNWSDAEEPSTTYEARGNQPLTDRMAPATVAPEPVVEQASRQLAEDDEIPF